MQEFQKITRRDRKAFLTEQCKEIEENSRMDKTRDLIKEIGDIKGTCHARMGMLKYRNGKDLTEGLHNLLKLIYLMRDMVWVSIQDS